MSSSSSEESISVSMVTWGPELERWFKQTGEIAQVRGVLYEAASAHYNKQKSFLEIPLVILSALTGFASVGAPTLVGNDPFVPVVLGLFSLLTSIMNTINSYYGFSRLGEASRMLAISYTKLYKFIDLELRLPVVERIPAKSLVKVVSGDITRLTEQSVAIPEAIKTSFKKKFKGAVTWPPELTDFTPIEVNQVRDMSRELLHVVTPRERRSSVVEDLADDKV